MRYVTWIVLSAASASAQHPMCDRLTGEWQGEGTLMGGPARFSMSWETTLQSRFIRLVFENQREGAAKPFQADAYFRVVADTFTGTWFDSRGWTLPLRGRLTDSSWTTEWGNAETEIGRTVYVFESPDRLRVSDWIFSKGQWKSFGSANYRRGDR